jgi:hypothetical protein
MCRYDGVNWRRLAAAGEGGKGGGGGGGDYLTMVVRKIFCSFFFCPAGDIWLLARRSRHINFLPLSSHDFVVILNSYVHYATEKVGYKI